MGRRMWRMVGLALLLTLMVTVGVAAQTAPPTLVMAPGSNIAQGSVDTTLVVVNQTWVAVVARPNSAPDCTGPTDPACTLLGSAPVNPDGSWTVNMSRAVEFGECAEVWFSFDNQATWQLWFGCEDTTPLVIPEPATLALVGAGLAGAGAYLRRRRRARS